VKHVISVRLSDRDYDALKHTADKRGVSLSTCARMLMAEGLRAQRPAAQAKAVLSAVEENVDLRVALRRLVFKDPSS
jgi:hypothetical protein